MSREREKDTIYSWLHFGVIVFSTSLFTALNLTVGIFIAVFVEYYDESNSKAGWIGSTLYFLVCFAYPIAIFLRRHFGTRPMILCASLLVVFAFVSTPFMSNFNFVFLTFSIPFGIGTGLQECLSIVTLREHFDRNLGQAMGIRAAWISVMGILYSYLLPIFFNAIGWRKTFFALSALGTACIVYVIAYRNADFGKKTSVTSECEPSKKYQEIEVTARKPRIPSYVFLRKKKFLFILVGLALFMFVCMTPPLFIIQYAKSLGYPLYQSKWLLVVHSFASLLGRLTIGRMADYALRNKKVSQISQAVVFSYGIASGLCSLTQSLPLMILCMGLLGCFEGMTWVNLPLLAIEANAGENVDEAYGSIMFVAAFFELAGPPLMGWIFDVTGDFRYVLYVLATCSVTGALIMGIGSYVTSHENDTSAQAHDKETVFRSKTTELKYLRLFGIKTILSDETLLSVVVYESAV